MKDGCLRAPNSTYPVGKQYDGAIGRERSLVKLHAGAWGTRSRQAHQKQESRSTSCPTSRGLESSQGMERRRAAVLGRCGGASAWVVAREKATWVV